MRYVFRLSTSAKAKLDEVAPPTAHRRSAFIRDAIKGFLRKSKQPLADRPHLRGRADEYKQVCAMLTEAQVSQIKEVYEDVSVSVVIQAAVLTELKKPRHRIKSFTKDMRPADATDQDTDADKNPRRNEREP